MYCVVCVAVCVCGVCIYVGVGPSRCGCEYVFTDTEAGDRREMSLIFLYL